MYKQFHILVFSNKWKKITSLSENIIDIRIVIKIQNSFKILDTFMLKYFVLKYNSVYLYTYIVIFSRSLQPSSKIYFSVLHEYYYTMIILYMEKLVES